MEVPGGRREGHEGTDAAPVRAGHRPRGRRSRSARRAAKAGLSPGTLVHVGERRSERLKLSRITYHAGGAEFREGCTLEECLAPRPQGQVTWINVDGLHEVEAIGRLGKHFGIHPLVLEDLLNTDQRPKLEDADDYLFLVVKMLGLDAGSRRVITEQISLVLGPDFVLSFQEREGDLFDPVRQRIRDGKGRLRGMGADYLAYRLLDVIVDHYFAILEQLDAHLDRIEQEILTEPDAGTIPELHGIKREILALRRSVWPMREVVSGLERGASPLVHEETRPFLRDLYDHTIQVIDTVEGFRDMASSLLDLYLSIVSNRMNEVMKTLTVFASIFLPLTFIAGVYGMNFVHMPELPSPLGYPAVLLGMLAIALGMLGVFRHRGWV